MTTTINASTSSGLVVTPDNSGNILLQYNGVAAPAFSAYNSADQSYSGATNTKVVFNTEEFDTNNNFASNRFTPTVAGYYQLNARVRPQAVNGGAVAQLYKNGSVHKSGSELSITGTQSGTIVSALVYANGTTDYFEIYLYVTNACTGYGGAHETWFNGCLIRGA